MLAGYHEQARDLPYVAGAMSRAGPDGFSREMALEATGAGGLQIDSAVANSGRVEALGTGRLDLTHAIAGAGSMLVGGGAIALILAAACRLTEDRTGPDTVRAAR